MKNVLLGFAAAIVIVCAAFLFLQHQAQEKLRADNEALAQQLAQLQTDNESISNRLASAGDSKKLPDEQFNELLKLRGEVGVLRQQIIELGKLQEENQQLREKIVAMQSQSMRLPTKAEYNWYKTNTINTMKWLGLDMKVYAADHGDNYATNFDQLVENEPAITNYPFGIDAVEFVNAGLVNGEYPEMIMFRETIPRHTPDGKWERIYALASGSVQTIISNDGNFDDYGKQQQQYNPPPNQ